MGLLKGDPLWALVLVKNIIICKMKQRVKTVSFCVLTLLISITSFAIKPDRVYRFYPEKLSLIYKDLDVTTSDGLKIKTWLFPAQDAASEEQRSDMWENPVKQPYKTLDKTPRPTIIIANGDAGNMSYQQLSHAQFFTSKGYNVVTFDWRGFGQSSQWEMDTNYLVYSELLLDYDAVIKQVLQQDEVDKNNLALYGWSTGAYLSMAAASKYENIKAFVAIGLMSSFSDAVQGLIKVLDKDKSNLIVPKDYPSELQPIYLAPKFNKSTFLIVGEKDDRTPVWMSQKIYSLLPEQKQMWVVQDAQHGGMSGPLRDFDLFHDKVLSFLEVHLN